VTRYSNFASSKMLAQHRSHWFPNCDIIYTSANWSWVLEIHLQESEWMQSNSIQCLNTHWLSPMRDFQRWNSGENRSVLSIFCGGKWLVVKKKTFNSVTSLTATITSIRRSQFQELFSRLTDRWCPWSSFHSQIGQIDRHTHESIQNWEV
jgi:hypothetical protein